MTSPDGPRAVGIILDGNRRWAAARGLSKLEGHRQGLDTLREAVRYIREKGVKHLAVFLFSTENWNRESAEVTYLMDLLRETAKKELRELGKEGVRIRVVGQRERFSEDIQNILKEAEEDTKQHEFTLWCCLSYGGRAEIANAARKASEAGGVTEESIDKNLWSGEMPDLDILIRTGGEQRLSGFLTWKSIYAELFFVEEFWPDFSESIFDRILAEYAARERRFGK